MNKKNVLIIFIVLAFVGIFISIAIIGREEENYLPDISIHIDVADVGQEILIEQKEFDEEIEFYNDTIFYLKDEQVDMLSEYTDF